MSVLAGFRQTDNSYSHLGKETTEKLFLPEVPVGNTTSGQVALV